MKYPKADVRGLLRERFGHKDFRKGQWEPIDAVLQAATHSSSCPRAAASRSSISCRRLILPGLTVVVSPLIALMKDQQDKLTAHGVDALAMHSHLSTGETREAHRQIADGEGEILYLTPERFKDREFFERLLQRTVALVRRRRSALRQPVGTRFPSRLSHARLDRQATRQAADSRAHGDGDAEVRDDIVRQLGMRDPHITITGFARPNLRFEVGRTVNEAMKDAIVEQMLSETRGVRRHLRRDGEGSRAAA